MKENIVKFLTNSITEEELKELHKWLSNPKNQSKFENHIKDYHDLNLSTLKNNVDKAYLNVKHQIDTRKPVTRVVPFYGAKFVKYAAAILILISSGYFFLSKDILFDQKQNENVLIEPGTNKATLTLSNGSEVVLDNGTVYQDKEITGDATEIIYKPRTRNAEIVEYNYLTVPRGGQYHATLSDGTEVWLNSESQLKYPVSFVRGKVRVVSLVYGEAYFKVSKSSEHNGDAFTLKMNQQDVTVLGTEFNVKAYRDETEVLTTLVEGSVSVTNDIHEELLIPGQQSKLSETTRNFDIYPVQVAEEISWRNGKFSFTNKPLKDITKVLSRWYDVDIDIANAEMEN
ncbi:MAG: FecR domain-containing protein, partial [Flavobacteriaceae bacterium]